MGFIEILVAGLNLNSGFFIDLIMNNLMWVFFFLAAGYIMTDGKHAIRNGIIYLLLVICSMDIFKLTGFTIYTSFGLGFLYLLRVPLLLFLDNIKGGSKQIPLAWIFSFFLVIAIVAFMT